ncbi:HD domain-containing protein [Leeuwenhoekiella parthenopeia]|uniref:HD domain-containing protein n=1 Tax=Leeuwenhoekiella parthenopeia TaxID=2890320 RepID=A0ABS8GSQ4_9FLAO|nr:HD domain-containing protein [Leeuwenhoekiella parthenopeia]MCC4213032.1 HD domain-containing protein [Leeuwenhoekiella parthenopeia]
MKIPHKLTIINDPIYGFITIPKGLIFDLIQHNYFQRLRRISQMGMSYLVYPGAHHTRFHHAIGCLHIMQKALEKLEQKGVMVSLQEKEAAMAAILLHDIGHGPFSHAMENSIVEHINHEQIGLLFIEKLNEEFNGSLTLAIKIFKGTYHRPFLHQLVSGQLDMDRTDYLKRDSFYTGMAEGNINTDRILAMLNVKDDQLMVEEKGIYTIEKFLVARRLMYWQVYLHKTSLVAEQVLVRVLMRAKELTHKGVELPASRPLGFFLKKTNSEGKFDDHALEVFAQLDDYDVISAMKSWCDHDDFVLRKLSQIIINRKLPRIKIKKKPFASDFIQGQKEAVKKLLNLSDDEADYFVFTGTITNQAYTLKKEAINILTKKGKVVDVVSASDQLSLKALSKVVTKNYICYPKHLI